MRPNLPHDCLMLLADASQSICSALDQSQKRVSMIIADRPGSFLHLLMQLCAESAHLLPTIYSVNPEGPARQKSRQYNVSLNQLAAVDGLQFGNFETMFLPELDKKPVIPQKTHSLESLSAFLPNVAVIALGQNAMKAEAWKGSLSWLKKAQPVIVGMVAGLEKLDLSSLKAIGYEITVYMIWSKPRRHEAIIIAVPPRFAEKTSAQHRVRYVFPEPEISRPRTPARIPAAGDTQQLIAKFFASQLIAKRGLHPFENYNELQWAWTGPGERTDLELPQTWYGAHSFLIDISETKSPFGMPALEFMVNNRPCPAEITETGFLIKTDIPIQEFSSTITLSIITPDPQRASEIDSRIIGSSIRSVEVFWS